jgi:hypothetical protein
MGLILFTKINNFASTDVGYWPNFTSYQGYMGTCLFEKQQKNGVFYAVRTEEL